MHHRMRRLILRASLSLFSFGLTGYALAWNATGHRLIADIAWQEMGSEAHREAIALLNDHPALRDWEKQLRRGKAPPEVTPRALFAEASTWADDIRRDQRYSDQPADGLAARNRDWHYVNWPLDRGPDGYRGGRLDQEVVRQSKQLSEVTRPSVERAVALVWLLHLVGDAHQPLHVASRPIGKGKFDDGGLDFPVHDDMKPRFSETSLHVWWDDLPGPPWLRGDRLIAQSNRLRGAHPAAGIVQGNVADWMAESLSYARTSVFPVAAPQELPWRITTDYRELATKISARRLAEAGVRLGRLLNGLLRAEVARDNK